MTSKTNLYLNLLSQAEKLFRHNRQGSYKTRSRYQEAFKRFLKYLAAEYHIQRIGNIRSKHFTSYVYYMQQNGKSAATIKTDLSGIRFWHDQIPNARYTLPANSELDLERRQFGKVDRSWSQEEIEQMLERCRIENRADIAACILIAYHTGLRIHEVLRIDTAIARDAIKSGRLTIKGKGGKIRQVPIDKTVADELSRWLSVVPSGHKLFVPPSKETHQAVQDIQEFIRIHRPFVAEENIESNLTFHGIRHSRAAQWYDGLLENGVPNSIAKSKVSKRLGHNRPDVTNIYLAWSKKNNK